jgi:hypothetical protein
MHPPWYQELGEEEGGGGMRDINLTIDKQFNKQTTFLNK